MVCGFCSGEVKLFGPVQSYVTFGVDVLAFKVKVGVLQLIKPPETITFWGVTIFWLTTAVGAEMQPFVAVTVNV